MFASEHTRDVRLVSLRTEVTPESASNLLRFKTRVTKIELYSKGNNMNKLTALVAAALFAGAGLPVFAMDNMKMHMKTMDSSQ